jgi:tetratricopeptide (TPR) repeat protein
MTTTFSSEGFDLDAAASSSNVIYEIGGAVSSEPETTTVPESTITTTTAEPSTAESYKQQGNQAFLKGEYLEAYEWYTQAIEATPGMKAEELLQQKEEWEKEQNRLARERLYERDQKKKEEEEEEEEEEPLDNKATSEETQFTAPPHEHATELSVYYANRAAALYSLQRYEEVVQDCNVALLWNTKYVKALVRRSKGHEQLEHYDLALQDAKFAFELGDTKTKQSLRPALTRLQKAEDARLEKLKTETLGQLKELGNSILGNFGLSLDNFQAVQDPNTGSYSISFQNNK